MDRAAALSAALAVAVSAGCTRELPPFGEAVLVVDTDLPVPLLAGELRLDLYRAGDRTWYESRTVALPDPRDWPASFSIYNPSDDVALSALVRLRVYPRGKVRDYRGERFVERPGAGVPSDTPVLEVPWGIDRRLVVDGVDRTPDSEPEPTLTIDRLLLLTLPPGEQGTMHLTMRGSCVGTMADLEGERSCIATEGVLEPVVAPALAAERSIGESQQGRFAEPAACAGAPRLGTVAFDEEVCVPGGVFVFGNSDTFGAGEASGVPERVAVMTPFFIDRYEVTVGRWRQAVNEGFASPDATPIANDLPIDPSHPIFSQELCTYTSTPGDREDHPLNCVSWEAAQAFCRYRGGDLPSEAQWEYAAHAAGMVETRYPWGNEDPTCERAVYGRLLQAGVIGEFFGGNQCVAAGPGPQPIAASAGPDRDTTPSLGLVGMGGSLAEHLRDAYYPLTAACWARASLHDPSCLDYVTPRRSLRGGSWAQSSIFLNPGLRTGDLIVEGDEPNTASFQGFRCVRAGAGP